MMHATERYRFDWEGIALSVNLTPQWLQTEIDGHQVAHLEIIADGHAALPVTETGYRSHFTGRDVVELEGGPVAYVRKWLDAEAETEAWKTHADASRQLSLF